MLYKPYLSRPTIQQIFKQIDSSAIRARRDGFADLIEMNTISLALATVGEKHRLIPWAIHNNIMSKTEADRECSDSSFKGPKYRIDEVNRINSKIEDKKKQFNRKALNALLIRSNRLFLTDQIERDIDILKEVLYNHEYLAMLIVIGGHVGGSDINSRNEGDAHLYLIKSIDLISKEILILTNIHSMNNVKTLNFSLKIKNAFESCNTLLF
jgi:hypothetical protein